MTTQSQSLAQLKQPTQKSQFVVESPVESPSAWIQNGQSPTEITLSVAILTFAFLWGVALVIIAISHLMEVLVPSSTSGSRPKRK